MGSGILASITGGCWKVGVPKFVHVTLAAILLPESSSGVFYLGVVWIPGLNFSPRRIGRLDAN
jgi:hypothetical protein